jgi:hypothetical protein
MKYGIYDTGLDVWIKKNWKENIEDGLTVTEKKIEAFQTEDHEKAILTLANICLPFIGQKEWMTKTLEVREI